MRKVGRELENAISILEIRSYVYGALGVKPLAFDMDDVPAHLKEDFEGIQDVLNDAYEDGRDECYHELRYVDYIMVPQDIKKKHIPDCNPIRATRDDKIPISLYP